MKGVRGPGPRGFRVENGERSGEIRAFTDKAGERASYEWAYREDGGGGEWIAVPVTNEARVTISGLTPGTRVWVRVRPTVKSVAGDWSEGVGVIVT